MSRSTPVASDSLRPCRPTSTLTSRSIHYGRQSESEIIPPDCTVLGTPLCPLYPVPKGTLQPRYYGRSGVERGHRCEMTATWPLLFVQVSYKDRTRHDCSRREVVFLVRARTRPRTTSRGSVQWTRQLNNGHRGVNLGIAEVTSERGTADTVGSSVRRESDWEELETHHDVRSSRCNSRR